MMRYAYILVALGLSQTALAASDSEYTRWMTMDKLGPKLWRATCFNEIRGIDPKAEYQTRLYIQPPYFTAETPEGSGILTKKSPRISQSGWNGQWTYLATLKGRTLQQTMSFTFTWTEDFDEPAQYHYVLCAPHVTNLNTGLVYPSGQMVYTSR